MSDPGAVSRGWVLPWVLTPAETERRRRAGELIASIEATLAECRRALAASDVEAARRLAEINAKYGNA